MQEEDRLYCGSCGWNLPDEWFGIEPTTTTEKRTPTDKKKNEAPAITGGRNDNDSTGGIIVEESNIPLASKGTRTQELQSRVKRLPGEDRDTDRLKMKMKLIDSQEYLPADTTATISSDELREEHRRRNRNSNRW
jgi:hypothetical protein